MNFRARVVNGKPYIRLDDMKKLLENIEEMPEEEDRSLALRQALICLNSVEIPPSIEKTLPEEPL